jgi:hypothetical protein
MHIKHNFLMFVVNFYYHCRWQRWGRLWEQRRLHWVRCSLTNFLSSYCIIFRELFCIIQVGAAAVVVMAEEATGEADALGKNKSIIINRFV